MVSENLICKLNDHLNLELSSSYFYLSIGAFLSSLEKYDLAEFFISQGQIEISHGMNIYNYIIQKGENINLETIQKPSNQYGSILDTCENGYEKKQFIIKSLYDLIDTANDEKDYASLNMLEKHIKKHIKEENEIKLLVKRVKRSESIKTS